MENNNSLSQTRRDKHFPCDFWIAVLAVFLLSHFSTLASSAEPLEVQLQSITRLPRYQHSHWGMMFIDLESDEIIYQEQPEKLFAPASVTKLFSVACLIDTFGIDHRFQTNVVRKGDVNDGGLLKGDLILIASGDLSFGGRTTPTGEIAFANADHTYANGNSEAQITPHDPLSGLNDLAQQVFQSGIRSIEGDVLVDDRLFEHIESTGSGPQRVTPIMINDNLIDLKIEPTSQGQPAKLTIRPESKSVSIQSNVVTVSHDSPLSIKVTEQSQNDVQITGEIPLGHKPVLRVYEVPDPAAHSRILFSESLQRVGVTIHQPSRQPSENENSAASLPEREQVEKLPVVARHTSPPISESARLILKVSHNLQASALPLLVATKHGERTLRDGLKHQHEFLTRAGVDVESVSFGGGAGGSRADCVTPKATVQLLRYMSTRSDFEPYKRALPRLGVDGTLAKNISPESPVRDKVQAKTGTLYWENTLNRTTLLQTKALAGYMTTSKGRSLAFAIFVNNVPLNEEITIRSIGNDLGKICETVYLSE